MSEAARARSGWALRPNSPEVGGAMANTAAVAEIAARAAVGTVGVQAVISLVRNRPLLAILLAVGVGYAFGYSGSATAKPRPNAAAAR